MEEADNISNRVIRRVSSRSRRIALRARRETEESTSESEHDQQSPKLGRKTDYKTLGVKNTQLKLALCSPRIDIIPRDNYKVLNAILGICHLNISFFHIWLVASIYNLQKSFSMLARTVRELPQPQRNLNSLSKNVDKNEEDCKSFLKNPSNQFARNRKQTSEGGKLLLKSRCFIDDPNTGESEDADYMSDDHSTYSRPHKSVTELDVSMDESLAESSGRESGYLSGIDLSFLNRSSTSSTSPAVSPQSITLAHDCGRPMESFHLRSLKHGAVAEVVAKVPAPAVALPQQPSTKGNSFAETQNILDSSSTVELLRNSVIETKYVTAIFEMTVGGIDELIDDVLAELKSWFDGNRGLMGVACEVQWSVPEKYRNRSLEMRMKSALHASLRENNLRVLNLKNNTGIYLPLTLAAAVTQENCGRDQKMNSFQGIYRRFYESLLPCQHRETSEWHKDYWTLESSTTLRSLPTPKPQQFVFGSNPTQLDRGSLIALNVIALKIVN